jgi:deoxyadenosine/deoxycytidine kinase
MNRDNRDCPRIVVVGPCASGKTTLVERLKARGYEAAVCAQEHSEIHNLWAHSQPDLLVALKIDLATIRERRGKDWPETIYLAQLDRLADAFAHATITIDTTTTTADQAIELVEAAIADAGGRESFVATDPAN